MKTQTDISKPSYYAIIPADVRYSKIPANAKLLYGEITALCNQKGFCWSSNQYFAELYGVSNTSVSSWVKQLIDAGFIKVEMTNTHDGTLRKLSLALQENLQGGTRKLTAPNGGGAIRKLATNNTPNNTKNRDKTFSEVEISKRYERKPSVLPSFVLDRG